MSSQKRTSSAATNCSAGCFPDRHESRDGLLNLLESKRKKSLLVLDQAHTAAPATASKYALDSPTTKAIRDLSGRFENRLFLSATPHTGRSNSFRALLEMLDPSASCAAQLSLGRNSSYP